MIKLIFIHAVATALGILNVTGAAAQQTRENTGTEELSAEMRRPDVNKIMLGISKELRLSSKQETRISGALQEQTAKFDAALKGYEDAAAQEKNWRLKMEESAGRMAGINRGLADVIRDFLDEEQLRIFDSMLEKKRAKTAAGRATSAPENKISASGKKKKLVKRLVKKIKKYLPGQKPGNDAANQTGTAAGTGPENTVPESAERSPAENEHVGSYP